jgi:hypothetical protein
MSKQSKNQDRLLSDIWVHTTLLKAFDDGFTPDDIKQGIIEIFAPFRVVKCVTVLQETGLF